MDAATAGKSNHDPKVKTIEIKVNSKVIGLAEKEISGAEIKSAAITQGVSIQANFVLQLELPNGTSQMIGDGDLVKVHNNMSFTAIRPDDNS